MQLNSDRKVYAEGVKELQVRERKLERDKKSFEERQLKLLRHSRILWFADDVSVKKRNPNINEPKVMGSQVKKVSTYTNFGFLLNEGFKEVDKDETKEFDELVLTEEEVQTINAENNLVSDENVSAGRNLNVKHKLGSSFSPTP
ncbi:hypothetical protein LguiA_016881 [Lonicera macranthoides]